MKEGVSHRGEDKSTNTVVHQTSHEVWVCTRRSLQSTLLLSNGWWDEGGVRPSMSDPGASGDPCAGVGVEVVGVTEGEGKTKGRQGRHRRENGFDNK